MADAPASPSAAPPSAAPGASLPCARLLTDLAARFLASAPPGTALRLEVEEDGLLRLSVDVVPAAFAGRNPPAAWPEPGPVGAAPWCVLLAALEGWRLERRHAGQRHLAEGTGAVAAPAWTGGVTPMDDAMTLAFRVRRGSVTGDLQSPEVLYALRELAARHPSARLGVRLPAGTRDVMRARAGLDSRPPAERR